MAIIDDFMARYPEFDESVVNDRLPFLIEEYPAYFNRPYEGRNKPAILALLAHLLTVDQNTSKAGGTTSGVVTSKSVGSVSKSYANKNSTSTLWDFFGGTKYGEMFIQLTSSINGGRFV